MHVESYEGMVLVFKDGTNYLVQGESEGYDHMRFIGRPLDVGHVRFNGRNWDIPTGKVPSVKTLCLKHGLNYLSGTPVRIWVVTSRYAGFLNAVAGMFFESSVGLGSVSVNVLSSDVLGSCYDTDVDDFEFIARLCLYLVPCRLSDQAMIGKSPQQLLRAFSLEEEVMYGKVGVISFRKRLVIVLSSTLR